MYYPYRLQDHLVYLDWSLWSVNQFLSYYFIYTEYYNGGLYGLLLRSGTIILSTMGDVAPLITDKSDSLNLCPGQSLVQSVKH